MVVQKCPKCGGDMKYIGEGGSDFIEQCEDCGYIIRTP